MQATVVGAGPPAAAPRAPHRHSTRKDTRARHWQRERLEGTAHTPHTHVTMLLALDDSRQMLLGV